ncbi:MAG: right-handed parallel beta-helix repeat-containing protein [Canidatus Methanoxibalbensis ujae]|nr:right-handed parallel beta-helix repeat-containing protein [Candidatus Methanoxibalbensis ujae]
MGRVKKNAKSRKLFKGIFTLYKCVKVFSPKVKSCLGGVKGKMKKSGKDMNKAIQHSGGHVGGNRGASRTNDLKGLSSKRLSSFVLTAISVVSVFVTVALLMTGTVEAQVAPNSTFVTVDVSPPNPPTIPADQITIGWSTGQVQKGSHSIHVTTTAATPDYAMVGVPTNFTLQSATQISYWGYTAGGDVDVPDEIFLFLDTDNDGEVDVILGNHWGPPGTGSWQQWNMSKGSWFTVDPRTGVTIPANISDYCDKGYKVLGVAIGAGAPESYPTGGVTVNVYLDNLTIDVDGDGNPEYTLDDDTGTIEVFCETINETTYCASIQDAINAALPGDTILVAAGTYNENVGVDKSVTLQGEGRDVVTVAAANPESIVFDVTADWVNISGFTVTGGSRGILLYYADHCNVFNNTLSGNGWGIGVYGEIGGGDYADYNTVKDNIILNNTHGIWMYKARYNTIADNTILNNTGKGIHLDTYSDSNTFRGNDIQGNNYGIEIGGPQEYPCSGNVVNYNNIVGNSVYGVYNSPYNPRLDATNNWWGDATSGPGPVGSGDNVSSNVAYEPWLGAPLELPGHYETLGAGTHTVDASAEADTKVTLNLTRDTEIYVVRYESQPFPDKPFPDKALGKWIDIHVSNPDAVEWPIYIELSYSDAEVAAAGIDESTLGLYYYYNDTFHRCSDTGVNIAENFIWAYVNKTEATGSASLVGKEFGAGGNPIPERVPALTPIGIIALITILSVVFAVATMKRKKSK